MLNRDSVTIRQPTEAVSGKSGPRVAAVTGAAFAAAAAAVYAIAAAFSTSPWPAAGLAGVAAVQILSAGIAVVKPSPKTSKVAATVTWVIFAYWVVTRTGDLLGGAALWASQDRILGYNDVLTAALQLTAASLFMFAARSAAPRPLWAVALASTPTALLAATIGAAFSWEVVTPVAPPPAAMPAVLAAGRMTTVTYCSAGGIRLGMDVYEPTSGAPRPAPLVIFAHGGAFTYGDRETDIADPSAKFIPAVRRDLNDRGFVVASIDYRLVTLYRWPAAIEDAKCAVRFARANSVLLGIDPNRIAAWGDSAGGNLVALLGTTAADRTWDVGQYLGWPSGVQAVVDMYGPALLPGFDSQESFFTNLSDFGASPMFGRLTLQMVFGGNESALEAASPALRAHTGAPPFLILNGAEDTLVPPIQSKTLQQRLAAAGDRASLVLVQRAGHGFDSASEQPSEAALVDVVGGFLVSVLG